MKEKELSAALGLARAVLLATMIIGATLVGQMSSASVDESVAPGWNQSYKAGATDQNGNYMGGSQILHLAGHQGRLYAGNGYWCDSRNIWWGGTDRQTGWAQVLRLDRPGGQWTLDLELGPQYLRPEILKEVTFHTDGTGKSLPKPMTLLLVGTFDPSPGKVAVSLFARDDTTGKWTRGIVYSGAKQEKGTDYSVRAMCVHRDKMTGVDRLFLSIGTLGIFSGVYDESAPGKVKWSLNSETGPVEMRPLAIIEANGDLLFSAGRKIYRRNDGTMPSYQIIEDMSDLYPALPKSGAGGIRGLTAIPNPNGAGESLIFAMWADKPSRGEIYRLDPAAGLHFTRTREVILVDLMSRYLSGNPVHMVGAAYSDFHPVTDPATGETLHLVGFETWIGGNRFPTWGGNEKGGFYAGAMVAIRNAKGHYTLREVNEQITPSKPVLVSPYCFALSPFEADRAQVIYFGGFDCNKITSHNTAWIFSSPLENFLRTDCGPRTPTGQ